MTEERKREQKPWYPTIERMPEIRDVETWQNRHVWADTGWIIDACTPAVEALCHLVLRTSFPFHDLPGIHQRYVEEFIGALVIGLNEQKQTKQRKRQENLKRIGDLPA